MNPPTLEVVALLDGREIARRSLDAGEYTLGRASACSIPIKIDDISRQHAKLLVAEDGSVQVEDLSSANGTFLDDEAIGLPTSWRRGQILRIGDALLHLVAPGEAAPVLPLPTAAEPPVTPPCAESIEQAHYVDGRGDAVRQYLPLEAREAQSYAVEHELARGGMGAVLQARESATRRTVAMKVMLREGDTKSALRFIEEAQVTAQLEHPNIVPVHDLGIDAQGQPFYTMKLVSGITLKKILELLKQRRPETAAKYPLAALLTFLQKIGDALAFAHSRGVIHRDLKPANIMIGKFGEVMVMDWGLAKIIGTRREPADIPDAEVTVAGARRDESEVFSTMAGTIMGTPHYMSPEQARGEGESLDARSDVFSLGVILYEILALERPFSGKNSVEVMQRILEGEAVPPAQRVRQLSKDKRPLHLPGGEVPESLDAMVRQALAGDPAQRYQSIENFQADLTAYQGGFATRAERAGAGKQFWFLLRRRKVESIAAAVVIAVGLGFGSKAVIEGRRSAKALADLRAQAPAFAEMANVYVEQLNLSAALEKLDAAIQLDPKQAAFHARRGDILQTQLRFAESLAAYDRALALAPGNTEVAKARAYSKELASSPTASEPTTSELAGLNALQLEQKRLSEAVVLSPRLSKSREALFNTCVARLAQIHPDSDRRSFSGHAITLRADGSFFADFGALKTNERTLEAFRGVPLRALHAWGYRGSDLSPLAGMPLEEFIAPFSKISDLRALHGAPLRTLDVSHTPVESLEPLRGCPLEDVDLGNTKVADLAPFTGAPLRRLNVNATRIADLSPISVPTLERLAAGNTEVSSLTPLIGTKLRSLSIGITKVDDLDPLRGLPLEELAGCQTGVRALGALVGMPLKRLDLSLTKIASIEHLRSLPLEYLNLRSDREIANFEPLASLKLRGLHLGNTAFKDGSVLRGQPLETLLLAGCSELKDISFLKELPRLKALTLPPALIDQAKELKSLRYLSTDDTIVVFPILEDVARLSPTTEQFWKNGSATKRIPAANELTPEHKARLLAAGQ